MFSISKFEFMRSNLCVVFFLSLVLIILSACTTAKKDESLPWDINKSRIGNLLLQRPAISLSDQWMTFIEKDSIILIRIKDSRSEALKIHVEYLKDTMSAVQMLDLNTAKFESFEPEKGIHLEIYKLPNIQPAFKILKYEAFARNEAREAKGIWIKTISRAGITKLGPIPCINGNTPVINKLESWVFNSHLDKGVFLTAQQGYNLLLYDEVAWVLYTGPVYKGINQMLHFIKPGGPFDNYSFSLSSSTYSTCLNETISDSLRITRVQLKHPFSAYDKIRIGQFTSEGNIWAQELVVSRILDNKLLRYAGEFD